jgi:hypothetical protein
MPMVRFKKLLASFTLHAKEVKDDLLYRLRPLLNPLRRTFTSIVIPGREISLDEA